VLHGRHEERLDAPGERELAADLRHGGEGQQRDRRAVLREQPRRRAALREGHERARPDLPADGRAARAMPAAMLVISVLARGTRSMSLLGGGDDAGHRRDGLDRVLPTLVSPDSITASAPSSTALATSLASARVGREAPIIDSSIWVATMTGLACSRQACTARFCTSGTGLERHLDAEVATGDHETVEGVDDLVEVVDRLRLLDLREHRQAGRPPRP
jgi:hypothetical protein